MLELITLGDTLAARVFAVLIPSQGDDRPYIGVSNDPETVKSPLHILTKFSGFCSNYKHNGNGN